MCRRPNSHARSCGTPPIPTRPCAPPRTAYLVSRPLPLRTGSGRATSPTCPARARAGCTWPCSWTTACARRWALVPPRRPVGRRRNDARILSRRSATAGAGGASSPNRTYRALRPGQSVPGYPLQRFACVP